MIPMAKPAPSLVRAPPRKAIFRIVGIGWGRWRVSSDDGMMGGTFFTREAALRFARREAAGASALILYIGPHPGASRP